MWFGSVLVKTQLYTFTEVVKVSNRNATRTRSDGTCCRQPKAQGVQLQTLAKSLRVHWRDLPALHEQRWSCRAHCCLKGEKKKTSSSTGSGIGVSLACCVAFCTPRSQNSASGASQSSCMFGEGDPQTDFSASCFKSRVRQLLFGGWRPSHLM